MCMTPASKVLRQVRTGAIPRQNIAFDISRFLISLTHDVAETDRRGGLFLGEIV